MDVSNLCPLKAGAIVGAGRWPQPVDASTPPWQGVVLGLNDVLAWKGSIAFSGTPSQAEVDEHVHWCLNLGLLQDTVPVLWNFGDTHRVYWSHWHANHGVYALRPYADDVCLWQIELGNTARRKAA